MWGNACLAVDLFDSSERSLLHAISWLVFFPYGNENPFSLSQSLRITHTLLLKADIRYIALYLKKILIAHLYYIYK
jgi:hypothetical protein